MAITNQTGIPNASGYNAAALLKRKIFSDTLLARFRCGSIIGNISNMDVLSKELKDCGDEVIFRNTPRAEIFDYVKGQELEVSTLEMTPISMKIDKAKYWNIFAETTELKQDCDLKRWLTEFSDERAYEMTQMIDRQVLNDMPYQVAPCNKGRMAGALSGAYDMGAGGAPVAITPANIIIKISEASAVLDEACIPEKDRFIVLPVQAKPVLMASPLTNAGVSALAKSPLFGGEIPDIMGFRILWTNSLPLRIESGRIAYTIPFGAKMATGFHTQLNNTRMIEEDARVFGSYWQGLQLYGYKVLRPEALGILYATFTV